MTAVFRTELAKQVRRPRTYVALGIGVILPIIATIALKANPPRGPEGPGDLFALAPTTSGLLVAVGALRFMSRFLLVLIVAVFAGEIVAGEASWGNLRYILVRPVGRGRLLAAKLAVAALFAVLATALIVLSGTVAGVIAFGYKGINLFGPFGSGSQSASQLLGNVWLSGAFVAWNMAAVVAFGFMISTLTDTPSAGVGAAVGLYITSQILEAITALGMVRHWMPTHHLDDWETLILGRGPNAFMLRGVLLQLPYVIAFCGFAYWRFSRKDILS